MGMTKKKKKKGRKVKWAGAGETLRHLVTSVDSRAPTSPNGLGRVTEYLQVTSEDRYMSENVGIPCLLCFTLLCFAEVVLFTN